MLCELSNFVTKPISSHSQHNGEKTRSFNQVGAKKEVKPERSFRIFVLLIKELSDYLSPSDYKNIFHERNIRAYIRPI